MLDIKWIRENREEFDKLLAKRGVSPISEQISRLDEEKRQLQTLVQQLQSARNEKARFMSYIKDKNSKEFEEARRDAMHINDKLEELMAKSTNEEELNLILDTIPNLPDGEVPEGNSPEYDKLIRKNGEIKRIDNPKPHDQVGVDLGMLDFAQTSKMSGSRFATLKFDLAKLERALINFMLDIHTKEHGFTEISPPLLVRDAALYGAGMLPKFSEDSFLTTDNYRLIPTAEVPLINLFADKIISREELPVRYVAATPCFRSEAGSAGRDTKGMIRMHQFTKVELVSITTPYDSIKEHEFITQSAEKILQKLELPYRIMLLCSGEMGFASKKTYDLEVWLPSQNTYREISSCSNCGDFQARRLKARYKEFSSKDSVYVHTLNGSALAVGRTIVAILENYQNADGSVTIPSVLVNYMNGVKKLEPVKEFSKA